MLPTSPNQDQFHIFQPLLKQIINPKDELVVLAKKMDWKLLEKELSIHYSTTGTPSKPIRLMCGLLIIKQLYKLGDETVVAQWIKNPYYLPIVIGIVGRMCSDGNSHVIHPIWFIFVTGLEKLALRQFLKHLSSFMAKMYKPKLYR